MREKISKEIFDKIEEAKRLVSSQPNEAMKLSMEAFNSAKYNNLSLEEAYSLLNMALVNRALSNKSSMLDYSFKALTLFEKEGDILGQIKALNLIGIAYFYSSLYEEAYEFFIRTKKLLEIKSDPSLLSANLNNIGEIYRESSMNAKALEYYNKAKDIAKENDLEINYAAILGNIGEIYFIEGQYDLSIKVYMDAHETLLSSKDLVSLGEIEYKIGKVQFKLEKYDEAEEYFHKALSRLLSIENKFYAIDTLIYMGQIYEEKDSRMVLDYYHKAIEFCQAVESNKKLANVYKLLSLYYEKQEDYKNALAYSKKFCSINEEVINSNIKDKLEILSIELNNIDDARLFVKIKERLEKEISKQKLQIEKIKKDNEILQKKAYEDELTGIPNRRSLNDLFSREFKTSNENLFLYILDIDNFKKYNDYWGHAEGDICIKKIASCIVNIKNDNFHVFARYGGEEFIYFSTSFNYNDALDLGNKIRNEVEKLGLYYMDKDNKLPVTISMGGVFGTNKDFNSYKNMIELADRELYRAKDMGRNLTFLKLY